MQPTRFLLDDWLVDTQFDTVRRGDKLVKLEPRTMQVLRCWPRGPVSS